MLFYEKVVIFGFHLETIKEILTLFFTGIPLDTLYEMEKGHKVAGTLSPLIPSSRIENAAVL